MEQELRLAYAGVGVRAGNMNAYEVADAIHGFTSITQRIGRILFGEDAELITNIRGIKGGTFNIDFFYLVAESAGIVAGLTGGSPAQFLDLIRQCIDMFKHLGGQPPNSVKKADGGSMYVENNNGVIQQFNIGTVNIVLDPSAGREFQKFAANPLRKSAESMLVLAGDQPIASANRDDVPSFVPIEGGELLVEQTYEVLLQIKTAVLIGKTRWKFYDGQRTFSAYIGDEKFLSSVSGKQERFVSGDTLRVRMRATQKRVKGKLKAEFVIEEVLDHVEARSDAQETMI